MFSPEDVLIVPNQFFKRTSSDFGCPFLNFLQNLKISICNQAVLTKAIKRIIDYFNDLLLILVHLAPELLLNLHLSYLTATISPFLYSKAARASPRACSNYITPSIAIYLLLMCSFLWIGKHSSHNGSVHFSIYGRLYF